MRHFFRVFKWNLLLSIIIGFVIGEAFQFLKLSSCGFREWQTASNQSRASKIIQQEKWPKKKVFIGIMTTPDYLKTRGAAIKETWLKEINEEEATLRFFSSPIEGFEELTTTLSVDDYIYPPQEKSFRMLSHFGSLADEYDWFMRIDDDSVIQWDNLSRFLSKIDSSKHHLIGSPGFGRDADDFIPPGKFYCMGGPGMIFSSALVRDIKPHVPSCTKQLYTNHEDIELCRCIWEKLDVYCTKSYEMNKLMHNNWKKNVEPGAVGYADNFRIPDDLGEDIIEPAITLHAAKTPENQREVRKELLKNRAKNLSLYISRFKESSMKGELEVSMLNKILYRKIEDWGEHWEKRYSEVAPAFVMRPPRNLQNALTQKGWGNEITDKNVYYGHNNEYFVVQFSDEFSDSIDVFIQEMNCKTWMTEPSKITKDDLLKRKSLTIIVPISGRGDTFHRFIDQYQELSAEDGNLKLVVAVVNAELDDISEYLISKLPVEYGNKQISTVPCQDLPFNRADCINQGISTLEEEEVFFVCDVDLILKADILDRVRLLTVENSVFFPVFFSQFEINGGREITDENGYWRLYSYGMVAMSKKTYQLTDGLNTFLKGWGGEDIEFADECISKKLNIIRAHDPSLFHKWHPKNCSATSSDQHQSCLATKMSNKMSQLNISKEIISEIIA